MQRRGAFYPVLRGRSLPESVASPVRETSRCIAGAHFGTAVQIKIRLGSLCYPPVGPPLAGLKTDGRLDEKPEGSVWSAPGFLPVARHTRTSGAWLVLESNLGLAANRLAAYSRALQDHLAFSADQNTPVITATKDHIAEYVRHLTRGHLGGFRPHVDVLGRFAVPTERS